MSLQNAIEALKNHDYGTARDIVARFDAAEFGVHHFIIKGLAESALKDWQSAARTFAAATLKFPEQAMFWLNRGIAEENLCDLEAAIKSQLRCVAVNPAQGEAYGNLSNLYRRKCLFAEAEAMARQALANQAPQGEALNCLGLALCKQGRFDEARACFVKAHEIAPDDFQILANHANLETEAFNFDAAFALFEAAKAVSDAPVVRHDEGLARLLAGDFARGFDLFEARLEMPNALRMIPTCPRWAAEDLTGKRLLIMAEQGFGDVVQFCRYQKFLTEGELVWAVPANLVRFLSGQVRGLVLDEKSPLPVCDYYVPVISLALRMGANNIGAGVNNYLVASEEPRLPQGKHTRKIGLVWAGSRTHLRDYERSVPLKMLEPLFAQVEADYYAPFIGAALDEIGDFPIVRLDGMISDFADTAALLKQMDCVIAVDTAVAHLAGALGVKTFLLLPHCPDWRWGVAGETSALYPSMTLVRQQKTGDWHGAVMALVERLIS